MAKESLSKKGKEKVFYVYIFFKVLFKYFFILKPF